MKTLDLNKIQKGLLILGLTIFMLFGLLPPWTETGTIPTVLSLNMLTYITSTTSGSQFQYHIFHPPHSAGLESYRLDTPRLVAQWILITVTTVVLVILTSTKQKSPEAKKE